MTYRYPQAAFPYDELVRQNCRAFENGAGVRTLGHRRPAREPLLRHHDRIRQGGRGRHPDSRDDRQIAGRNRAPLHLLPTLWFRNTWSWGEDNEAAESPRRAATIAEALAVIEASHDALGEYRLRLRRTGPLLFTENETNVQVALRRAEHLAAREGRLPRGGRAGKRRGRKSGRASEPRPRRITASRSAASESRPVRLRLQRIKEPAIPAFDDFDRLVAQRREEADEFYARSSPRAA